MTCGLYAQKIEKTDAQLSTDKTLQTKMVNLCGTVVPGDLVINGGFEEYSSIPTGYGQFTRACNWMDDANLSTPDYFHRNAPQIGFPSYIVSIPINGSGNQDVNPVYGGDAYAGMWVRNGNGNPGSDTFKTKLVTPLLPNTDYTLRFDISLADNHPFNPVKLQAYLGGNIVTNTYGDLPIQNDPNGILLNSPSYANNTAGWDTVTLNFTTGSVAGQEYLYLGGISNADFVHIVQPVSSGSYFYIDNVSLIEECPACDESFKTEIRTSLWETFQQSPQECGLYSFTAPQLDDCIELVIDWGNGVTNTITSNDAGTVLSNQYTTSQTYSACHRVFIDGVLCDEYCARVPVECEECPECDLTISNQIYDDLWNTFQEDSQECGLYSFDVPQLDSCYEIRFDWGDGQTNTVSSNQSGNTLSHQYTADGSFTVCTQILVDGQVCGETCKTVTIDCFTPGPSCDWLKSIGTANGIGEQEQGVSVVVDSNNDVILLGASLPNTNIEGTVIAGTTYLSKYDPDGCFISATDISFVGVPVNMEINNNDELLILTKDNIGYNGANNNYYLNKLDSSGNLLWTVTVSYTLALYNGVDTVKMDLKRATDEVFLLTTVQSVINLTHTGGTETLQQILGGPTNTKASIIKINSNGSFGWSQTAFGPGYVGGHAISASENTDELFFLGNGLSEDSNSNQQLFVTFRDHATGTQNNAALIPNTHGFSTNTDFVAKFTASSGAFIDHNYFPNWRSGGTASIVYNHNTNQLFVLYLPIPAQVGESVAIVENNLTLFNEYSYPTGGLHGAIVNGSFLYVSGINNSSKFFVAKINNAGVVWEKTPSNSFSSARDVAFNGNKIYTTGYFRDNYIHLSALEHINHIGNYDGFITRLEDQGGSGIFLKSLDQINDTTVVEKPEEETKEFGFTMYPNPASNEITLKFADTEIKKYQVSIRNVFGKIVLQSQDRETLQIHGLSRGVYFVEITTQNGKHSVQRLMVE
jgi:hypothetical protein